MSNRNHRMGDLKERMMSMDASKLSARQAASLLGTTVATIYSLSARYNVNFRKADWGEYRSEDLARRADDDKAGVASPTKVSKVGVARTANKPDLLNG